MKTRDKMIKISMNLSSKSIENIEKIKKITHTSNKTTTVAIALMLARSILEEVEKGKKIIIRDKDSKEREIKFLY